MGQQSSSQSSKDNENTSKAGATESVDKGFQDLKQGLVKDAGQLGGGLKDLASGVADDAKHAVEGQLDSQKGRVVEGLGGVADALRRVSKSGNRDEGTAVAPVLVPYIEGAADQVERASAYFEKKSLGEVARDVEDFARREPALFLGGAFALGLLGGRFLKASQPAGASASYGGYGGYDVRGSAQRSGQRGGQSRDQRAFGAPQGQGQAQDRSQGQNRNGNGNGNGNGQDGSGKNAPRQGSSYGATQGSGSQDAKAPLGGAKGSPDHASGSNTPGNEQSSSRGVSDDKNRPNLGATQGGAQEKAASNGPTATGGNPTKEGNAESKSSGGKPVGS